MRWPDCTDPFRRCCGLREGPRSGHYDAWLARERLNQLKRLEIRLADLTRENAELSARLGQAVGILDSYHSFDLDQLGIAQVPGAALAGGAEVPRQNSGGRRRSGALSAASSERDAPAAPSSRGSSLARSNVRAGATSISQGMSRRMAMNRPSMGGGSIVGNVPPAPPTRSRVSSLQFQPTTRTMSQPPARVRQMVRDSSPDGARRTVSERLADIPSREELDTLLRRSEPRRTSIDTVIDAAPPAARARGPSADDATSVASAPAGGEAAPALPTIGEGSGELKQRSSADEDEGARRGRRSDDRRPAAEPAPHRRSQDRGRTRTSLDVGLGMGSRVGSFSFAPGTPSSALDADTPRQMPIGLAPAPQTPNVNPPSLPAVMSSENTQPVRDDLRLSTQARGQVYTAHYSRDTSPFARAAGRMPSSDGKMPLSRHLPPSSH